jgi:HAMP domain-containing protein
MGELALYAVLIVVTMATLNWLESRQSRLARSGQEFRGTRAAPTPPTLLRRRRKGS